MPFVALCAMEGMPFVALCAMEGMPFVALCAMEGTQGESKTPRDGGAHGAKHKVRAVLWTAWTGWTIWTTAQDLGLSQS